MRRKFNAFMILNHIFVLINNSPKNTSGFLELSFTNILLWDRCELSYILLKAYFGFVHGALSFLYLTARSHFTSVEKILQMYNMAGSQTPKDQTEIPRSLSGLPFSFFILYHHLKIQIHCSFQF